MSSERIECPACGQKDCSKTTDTFTTHYHCFRASCNYRATVANTTGDTHVWTGTTEDVKKLHEPYQGELLTLPDWQSGYLQDRYGLKHWQTSELRQSGEWFALPICAPNNHRRGWLLRWPWNRPNPPTPKSKTYMDVEGTNGISWAGNVARTTTVLVEDMLSALRLQARGFAACALLGTGLNAARVSEIQSVTKNVVIALDNDATGMAFSHVRKWGPAFKSCRVQILPGPDIKDMTTEELEEFCGQI